MVVPGDFIWKLSPVVVRVLQPIRTTMGEFAYLEYKTAFQAFVCNYLTAHPMCDVEQGKSISPFGCPTKSGWNCLKLRWHIPGGGKSGGLRTAVAVHWDD